MQHAIASPSRSSGLADTYLDMQHSCGIIATVSSIRAVCCSSIPFTELMEPACMLRDAITNAPDRYTCCRHGSVLGKAVRVRGVVNVAAMGEEVPQANR